MTNEGYVVGMTMTLLGVGLNILAPVLNPVLNQNLGLWGVLLLLLGVGVLVLEVG